MAVRAHVQCQALHGLLTWLRVPASRLGLEATSSSASCLYAQVTIYNTGHARAGVSSRSRTSELRAVPRGEHTGS